jgi:ABC-type phosphate transport system substrate-binding protein
LEADFANINRFMSGQCQAIAWTDYPTTLTRGEWLYGFRRVEIDPTAALVGQAKSAVIVHEENVVRGLSVGQIQKVLMETGRDVDWATLGGSGGKVKCFGESQKCGSRQLLRRSCLQYERKDSGYLTRCFYAFRKDFVECADTEEVVKKVRQDRAAIGFVLWAGQAIKGVKVLPIRLQDSGPLVSLKEGPWIQEDYPLSEKLILYVHPSKPAAAVRFAEFAVGPEGSAIAEKAGLFTPYMQRQAEARVRLDEAKTGKGVRIALVGPSGCGRFVEESANDYVRAAALVQTGFSAADTDMPAVGAFVSQIGAAKEILLLEDRPGDRALGAYGKRWNDLAPAECMFAGRAAAVVVSAGSKLDSLTAKQVQSVFSGEAKDWQTLGTGPTAPAAGRITRYGLPGHEQAARVFYKECLPAEKMAAVTTKKDSAEVLSAVAGDPQGIGFIDLATLLSVAGGPATQPAVAMGSYGQGAKIPPGMAGILASEEAIVTAAKKAGVKVLAIRVGTGASAKDVTPSAENIRTGMYPFAQRLFLYVHPKASDTAKDFAKFIATCGQSEASPYTDTVKAVAETYRKHGLIPLAVVQPPRSLFPTSAPMKRDAQEGKGGSSVLPTYPSAP